MKRIVYQQIASCVDARLRCIRDHTNPGQEHFKEWIDRHGNRAQKLVDDYLPHGSGIDNGVRIDLDKSTGEKLVFRADFRHMDGNGYYDGWTEHTITVRASLIHELDIKIGGRNRNDIKDYLHECFDYALQQEVSDERQSAVA